MARAARARGARERVARAAARVACAGGRGRKRSLVALAARAPGFAGAVGRARRAVPRALQGRSSSARRADRLAKARGPLQGRDRARASAKEHAARSGLAGDDRERLRAHRALAGRRRRVVAVHAGDWAALWLAAGSLRRRARRRDGGDRGRRGLLERSAPPLRLVGPRDGGVQHGLRGPRRGRAQVQHERFLGAVEARRLAAVGDDALRAENPRGRRRDEEPEGVRARRDRAGRGARVGRDPRAVRRGALGDRASRRTCR